MLKRLIDLLPKTTITIEGKPYLTRYYALLKDRSWGNVYIHHFHTSDQGDELHNHPWAWGFSFILAGGYIEEKCGDANTWVADDLTHIPYVARIIKTWRRAGTFNFIRKEDFHRTDLIDEKNGAWTIFFTGKRHDGWGFLNRHTSEFKDFRLNPEAIP